jgi:hypothetical protein
MSHGTPFDLDAGASAQSAAGTSRGSGSTLPSSALNQSGNESGSSSIPEPFTAAQPSNPSATNQQSSLLQRLESIVDQFRLKQSSKSEAVSALLRVLDKDPLVSNSGSRKEEAFASFLAEILSIDDSFEGPSNVDPDPPVDLPRISSSKKGKNRATSFEPDGVGSDDDDDIEDRPSKRRKLKESEMPWVVNAKLSSTVDINPSCEETCRLLRIYQRDVSSAKFYARISPKAPPGIPTSQWERIFKGEAIDLNHVLSSLHHIVVDEERKGRMGDAEISFGVSEAKKHVRSSAEWASAWRRASKAISFAFPHRADELYEYGDYIEGEFAAKLPSSHSKIILYDIALRNEVGAGQHTLLTETHKFNRLYSAIVMPDGVETVASNQANKKGAGNTSSSKPEICNKFNNGTCKASDAECKYRHLCKECRKPGHVKKDCKEQSK